MADKVIISTGLKFKSISFSDTADVVKVVGDKVDVMLTTSEGHARIINGWELSHIKDCFDRGEYTKAEKEINFGVW